jgi:hypothetical protein
MKNELKAARGFLHSAQINYSEVAYNDILQNEIILYSVTSSISFIQ